MAAPKKKKKKQQGGEAGRPAMSVPRVQVFGRFGGCNFQMSPRDFEYVFSDDDSPEQTDLMSNLMVVQNNAAITPNQTIETRPNITKLFSAPVGTSFTGVATLVGGEMYAACSDLSVRYGPIPDEGTQPMSSSVDIFDVDDDDTRENTWTFLGYADDCLVGMTEGKQIWTGTYGEYYLKNAKKIPDPSASLPFSALTATGMTISATPTASEPFRVSLQYTLLNRFGPTLPSPMLTFYASKPTVEWSGLSYVTITGSVSAGYDTTAVELYYAEGEYQEPNFLARVPLPADAGVPKPWSYKWMGYLYDTSSWLLANLSIPTQNYTAGVPASMMAVHDNQLYFWGGTPEHRIWVGGNAGNRFSVSTGTGGGFVDCEPGVGNIVKKVLKFKTQQGAAIVTALCDNKNSQREHRFNLVESNISLSNEQSVKGWDAEKIAGTVGCKSPTGAIVAGDGLYAVSRYGLALTTLTMEYNSQLQVQYVSDPIEPVFLKQYGSQLTSSVLFCVNDILYMTFGQEDESLDTVIFCYDIARQAWWTYTLDDILPEGESILNMLHVDYQGAREGIGIITQSSIYLLPTTRFDERDVIPHHEVLIESAELSTAQPIQNMHHLSQLEFRFDYFIGDMEVIVQMIDQFGRKIKTEKRISHSTMQYQLSEYIRIDQVVESYKVTLKGKANMRLTHFISKNYPKNFKVGMVWGFDSRQSHLSSGSIHKTFNDYNDVKKAIVP